MGAFAARVVGAVVVVSGAALASCASHPNESEPRVGKATSAVTPVVITGSATRVCQLIGETDYQTGGPTVSLTASRFGVHHTDLGYPVQQGSRVWFFFGDTTPAQQDADPLGFTDQTPENGCPRVDFLSPGGTAQAQAITLDGVIQQGFRVPTGFVFDGPNSRFIGGITTSSKPQSEPIQFSDSFGVFATSALATPRDFRTLQGAPRDDHFFMIAPWIVDGSTVPQIALPDAGANSDGRVLLVWGSQRPQVQADGTDNFRRSPVFLAAVRIEHLTESSNWRFFHRDDTTGVTWSSKAADSTPVMFHGAVGEFSVSFDEATKQWRMVYAAPYAFFPDVPGSAQQFQGIVVMRTADRPEGPWSKTIPLFVPKEQGEPTWGDTGRGLFYHDANPRLAWTTTPNGTRVLAPIFGDSINQGTWALPPGPGCADSFPSWCPAITLKQDVDDDRVGCCSRSDHCCDFAFDQIGFTGNYPHFSWSNGNIYGAYLVQPFTKEIGPRDGRAPNYPTAQRVYYTMSTLNPYVVVLMSTGVALDLDEDGVPNSEDNCPTTWNPGQQNCNEDAEDSDIARGISVLKLGDACDPVPCPDSNTDMTTENPVLAACIGANQFSASICVGRILRDDIDLTPVGAGIDEPLLSQPVIAPRPTVPVQADTRSRFCQANTDDPNNEYDCDDLQKMGDVELQTWPSDVAEKRSTDHLWHRITIATRDCRGIRTTLSCARFGANVLPRGASFPLGYGTEQPDTRWLYQTDYDFWMATDPPRIPDPTQKSIAEGCQNALKYGTGTCLDGRLWLNADTLVGSTTSSVGATQVGIHGEQLANHYIHNAPDKPYFGVHGGLRARQLFFIKFTLPDPAPEWRYFAGVSLPLIREDNHLVAVFADGRHENADYIASDTLRGKLLDPDRLWLSPVEASPFVGGRSSPVGIALTRDGRQISSVLLATHDGVLMEATNDGGGGGDAGADAGTDAGEICVATSDGIICSPASATPRAASAPVTPSASRTNFAALYSRAEGRVFVVGGRDASGALLDQVSMYRLDVAQWQDIPLPRHLGDVVAATYSWRDGRLWVIDYDPADATHRTKRLLRIEPATRDMQVVARAREVPAPKYDFRGLFLDLDGNVGVFASSERSQKHRVAVLHEVAGGLDVKMTLRRDRALSAQPIVDVRGVTLYYVPGRQPEDPSKDPDDDPVAGDKTNAASRMHGLPLRNATMAQLTDLLQ